VCFALDVAKGLAPALAARAVLVGEGGVPTPWEQAAWLAAGCGAILGHVFSLYLRFRGGKGVATSLGVVLGMFPYLTYPGAAALAVWIAVTLATRYVSVGSITAAGAFLPLFVLFGAALGWPLGRLWPLMLFAGAMAALVVIRHVGNIRRLLKGTEHRIDQP
jgi:glycerol-3-phosphate acyltransferase PlsY